MVAMTIRIRVREKPKLDDLCVTSSSVVSVASRAYSALVSLGSTEMVTLCISARGSWARLYRALLSLGWWKGLSMQMGRGGPCCGRWQ